MFVFVKWLYYQEIHTRSIVRLRYVCSHLPDRRSVDRAHRWSVYDKLVSWLTDSGIRKGWRMAYDFLEHQESYYSNVSNNTSSFSVFLCTVTRLRFATQLNAVVWHHLQSFFFVSADALHDLIYLIDLNRFVSSREPRYFYTKRKSFLFFTLSWSQIWSKNILLYMIFWNASRNIDIIFKSGFKTMVKIFCSNQKSNVSHI